MIVITLRVGDSDFELVPGDTLDFREHGILVWMKDEEAEAYRLLQQKRQREVRATLQFVEEEGARG